MSAPETLRAPASQASRRTPLLVLGLILFLTLSAAVVLSLFVRAQQQSRFDRETQAYSMALEDRVNDYDRLLRTVRAAWQVNPDLRNEADFSRFVDGIDLARQYPGVQALGFGTWSPQNGGPGRSGPGPAAQPQGQGTDAPVSQPARVPISVIGPATAENLGALGFDLYSDPVRRAALELARGRADVQASGRVALLQQDDAGEPLVGFLLTLPVWPPGQTAAQGAQPQGFIYMAIRADQFLSDLGLPGLETRLSIGVQLEQEPLSRASGPAYFQNSATLQLAGQSWTLTYAAPRSFGQDAAAAVPVLVTLAGLLISGLAYLLVSAQVTARRRAEDLNVSLGQARARQEQARAEFEAIFQSMQDAAAFTTPDGRIRLINRALEQQFGHAASALIGQPLSVLHQDRRLAERQTFQALTTPYRRADGTSFSGEAQRSAVQDASGQQLGLLEVVRDVTARVAAEQAIVQGERRYRGVLDAIPHILQVSDGEGKITYVNTQHRELLGHDHLTARMTAEGFAAFEQLWQEVRQDGKVGQHTARADVQLRVAEHEQRWFTLRLSPIDSGGHPTAAQGSGEEWVTSATDMHDRLMAERRAQRNEERYRAVLEGLPQIVWRTDPGGGSLYFNRRWEEYVGAARSSEGFLSLLHPEDRAEYQTRWATAIRSGRPFEAEHRLLSATGRYRSFVTRGLPVLDSANEVIEWVGTTTDVDDSVYEETAARLLADVSEDLAGRRVLSPLVLAAATADPAQQSASRSAFYRAALGRLTGRLAEGAALWAAPPELLATASLHPAWQTRHMQAFLNGLVQQVIHTEDPLFVPSHPLLHAVNCTGTLLYPLLGAGGRVCGVLGVFSRQELTSRDHDLVQEVAGRFAAALDNDALQDRVVQAQRDLQALNQSLEHRVQRRTEELENANRELEAFSYSVSHDLRTPLRHIVGFGDLLGKELLHQQVLSGQAGEAGAGLSAKGQRYLNIITESAGRMHQLIDDLLEFSRMGRQELRRADVDLRALLKTSWAALEPDRHSRDVTLNLPGALPQVPGDPALLGLVITNLLSNAIKYTRTREHAIIDVSAAVTGAGLTLTIRDNGVGFDPQYLDKLFGVFQRLHRADEFEGIGIGLANVRRIVNRHGGRVGADARPGEWAAFWITLPLTAPPEEASSGEPAPQPDRRAPDSPAALTGERT